MVPRHFLPLLLLLPLCGCSLKHHIDKRMAKVEAEYADTKAWDQLPLRTISWNQAVTMIRRNNTDLIRINNSIRESERNEMGIYTQMIPGLTYYAYYTSSLKDLTNRFNNNQLSSTANISFFMPTLTQVPYQLYASKATTFSQMKAKEGKERDLISSLYRYVRSNELRKQREQLDERLEPASKGLQKETPYSRHIQNWREIARLLGDYNARWVVLPKTMPHIDWKVYEPRTGKLDPLIVCQFALRLEQARMSQYGIALRYLPTVNTNLYSPSLFTSTGGTYSGTFLDSDDTKLNFSVSYYMDTDLSNWHDYMRSKDNYDLVRKEVFDNMMEYRNKLYMLKESYAKYAAWRSYMLKHIAYLKESTPDTAEAFLERRKEIINAEKELVTQEEQAIESEALLIQQYGLLK